MDTATKPTILVAFAGGPHTAPRVALLQRLLQAAAPAAVYLTGREFVDDPSLTNVIREQVAVSLILDPSVNTWESCRFVAEDITRRFAEPVSVTAVTSNYHAARLAWLFSATLPKDCTLQVKASPDLKTSDFMRDSLTRKLVIGEVISWLYCAPLGLLARIIRALGVKS